MLKHQLSINLLFKLLSKVVILSIEYLESNKLSQNFLEELKSNNSKLPNIIDLLNSDIEKKKGIIEPFQVFQTKIILDSYDELLPSNRSG